MNNCLTLNRVLRILAEQGPCHRPAIKRNDGQWSRVSNYLLKETFLRNHIKYLTYFSELRPLTLSRYLSRYLSILLLRRLDRSCKIRSDIPSSWIKDKCIVLILAINSRILPRGVPRALRVLCPS